MRRLLIKHSVIFALLLFLPSASFSFIKNDKRILIDTFSSCIDKKTALPCGWRATRSDVTMFSLQQEGGDYFVRIQTHGGCTAIGKRVHARPSEMSYLHWRWRVHILPTGGKENEKKKADSGAGVYVVFKGSFRLNTILKYVWSATLPMGTVTASPYNGRTKIIVLESGKENLGKWIPEAVNVNGDYKSAFHAPPPEIVAVGILSDADNTRSFAKADYDDFYLERSE
jgi:hypothetical protein